MKRFTSRASTQRTAYRVERGTCAVCQFRERCTSSLQDRTISRLFDQKLLDEAKQRLSEPIGQELLKQRKLRAEEVFALAKELHGLTRTRFMVRWKVQIQLWLAVAAMNIEKALKQLQKTGIGDNNYPDRAVPCLSTLAEFAKDITAHICHFLCRPQPHFGNNPSPPHTQNEAG